MLGFFWGSTWSPLPSHLFDLGLLWAEGAANDEIGCD